MDNSRKQRSRKHDKESLGKCAEESKRDWSPVEIVEATAPVHPLIRHAKKTLKAHLLATRKDIEESMRVKYERLIEQIDVEIDETNRQLESFYKVNDAIYENSTKRLKRMTDAVTDEMEHVRNIHDNAMKDVQQMQEKAKIKAIRDFKQEATKLLQTQG
ncbi:hypothetical protein H310_10105 [Aphanomyces invadans]|uniref:Uncharacterized protein n=1 Tax=Aphanomyces invadans TaxID=157072 RepID=A0A024TU02_9STRA|nr:hypothetical protein H310_10105 [Aphanomyces invadans]ETV96812.1 hypothetical protein H310_10105 [Aphanomyces invadans]|eukprot:XP_008874589.1 hypothetical protein H310_10105 [Aphanomyces invadans]